MLDMVDKKIIHSVILGIYVLGIFYAATMPVVPGNLPEYTDKIVHFAEFFILSFIVFKTAQIFNVKRSWISWLILFSIALTTELVQLRIEGRSFSPFDLLADSLGILAGYGLWRFIKHYY